MPVAVRLDLPASVWFVAGIPLLPDPRSVFIPGDEIMVVFSRDKMRGHGLRRLRVPPGVRMIGRLAPT